MNKKGKFDKNKEFLLIQIYNLCKYGKKKTCKATTQFLATLFYPQITTRQVYRYLKALREEGKIEVATSGLMRNGTKSHLYMIRTIKALCEEPASAKKVLEVQMDKTLSKEEKFSLSKKAIDGTITYTKISDALLDSIPKDMVQFGDNVKAQMDYQKKMAEIKKLSDDYDKEHYFELKRREWEILRDDEANRILNTTYRGQNPPGETPLEKLTWCAIDTYKQGAKAFQTLLKLESDTVSAEELKQLEIENKLSEFQFLAESTTCKSNKWEITIYLGGTIEVQLNLFDYVNFTPDSEDFKLFQKIHKEVKTPAPITNTVGAY